MLCKEMGYGTYQLQENQTVCYALSLVVTILCYLKLIMNDNLLISFQHKLGAA